MTVHSVYFRVTDEGGEDAGVAGPKTFRSDLTFSEADELRARLLRLESAGLVTDVDVEPVFPDGGGSRPIHELLDVIDPMYTAGQRRREA